MQQNDPAAHEAREINEVVQRLRDRYPDIDPDRVHAVVTDAHRVFDGQPIRDFVPVFIERALPAPPWTPLLPLIGGQREPVRGEAVGISQVCGSRRSSAVFAGLPHAPSVDSGGTGCRRVRELGPSRCRMTSGTAAGDRDADRGRGPAGRLPIGPGGRGPAPSARTLTCWPAGAGCVVDDHGAWAHRAGSRSDGDREHRMHLDGVVRADRPQSAHRANMTRRPCRSL